MHLKCTICLSLYDRDSEICALLCGHLYHVDCINHWLSTNSSCPSCRKKVQRNKIVEKLYLEHEEQLSSTQSCPEKQTNELCDVRAKLTEKEMQIRGYEGKMQTLKIKVEQEECKTKKVETKLGEEKILTKVLRKQIDNLKVQQDEVKRAKLEVDTMRDYLTTLKNVELVVKGSEAEVTAMMAEYGQGVGSVKQLATHIVMLKRELELLKQTKRKLKDENEKQRRTLSTLQRESNARNEQIKRLEKDVKVLRMQKPSPITPQPISRVRTSDLMLPMSPLANTPRPIDVETPRSTNHRLPLATKVKDIALTTLNFDDDLDETNDLIAEQQNTKRKLSDNSSDESHNSAYVIKIKGHNNTKNKRSKIDPLDANPMMSYGIMKKKTLVNGANNMSVRTGYNGMGSHGKYVSSGTSRSNQVKMSSFFNR